MSGEAAGSDKQQRGPVRRFFGFIFRWVRNYFAFIGCLVTVLPLLLVLTFGKSPKPSLDISAANPATLTLSLVGTIAERGPAFEDLLWRRLLDQRGDVYLPEVRAALKQAAKDKRVGSIVVFFRQVQASPAEFVELRRILADFRAAGKTVHAVLEDPTDWSYYVASVADRVLLNPASSMTLTGPSFQLVYFGEAIKKVGVDIDVVRVGKYKSAFEPFVQNEPSEATLEQYKSMQSSLMEHVVSVVAEGRKKPHDEVLGWFKKTLFTADAATAAGIVDALGYGPEGELTVEEYGAGAPADESETVTNAGGIALIEAVGEINMASRSDFGGDDSITPTAMARQLNWALEEDDVKAVVMRVSSPGGSATASDIIWEDVRRLAEKKPVVVSMGAYAASGGYYISAPATRIIAEPTTITGSIGVIGMLPSFSSFREKYGVSFHIVTSSDRANMLSGGSRATDEDKRLLDETIGSVYKAFVANVAAGRKLPVEQVEALAQGRVYTGIEAKALKLVDELGGIQTAFATAKELAGFDKEKLYPVLRYQGKDVNFADCLKDPTRMLRCLRDADGRLGLMALAARFQPTGMDTEQLALRVKRWADADGRAAPLALWPSYLSVRF